MKLSMLLHLLGAVIASATLSRAQSVGALKAVVGFEQQVVNASEGNVAVVCVTTLFISNTLFSTVTVNVSLYNLSNLSLDADHLDDFDSNAIASLSFSHMKKRQCLRISIKKDNTHEELESFGLELESMDPLIFIFRHRMMVNILETCYNGELRLRDGFDDYQGRVEVCFDGVWGTVCHSEWDDVDAQVVCRQLGLNTIGAKAFPNATFGPASYALPVHFDGLECIGGETQLTHCWHDKDAKCLHSEDASVDCLGRDIVGAPCTTEGQVRLVDGQDKYQGRVEICVDGIYSTVCENGWDNKDAEVVCKQLGLSNSTSETITAVGSVGSAFRNGVGSILFSKANCSGRESNILNCSLSIPNPTERCTHFTEAGVDCLGRDIDDVVISFERLYQENGEPLAIREGKSLQLCVVVESGVLPNEQLFNVFPEINQATECIDDIIWKRGTATRGATLASVNDFMIEYPIHQKQAVYLGPDVNRSCINITAIDDIYQEEFEEYLYLELERRDKSNTDLELGNNDVEVIILDNDVICENQGSVCIDTKTLDFTCIPTEFVCDGIHNCSDGSDEDDCPDYCEISQMEGLNCLSEKLCVPQDYVCDGIPDCVRDAAVFDELNCNSTQDNCVHGDIRTPLLGGVSDDEGVVEVCVNGTYYPVSLNKGRFSVTEATVICKQLKLGNAGIPLSTLSSFGFQLRSFSNAVIVKCNNDHENITSNISIISSCTFTLSNTINQQQASVRCFESDSCQDGEIRIVNEMSDDDDADKNSEGSADFLLDPNELKSEGLEGRIEICYQNVWGAIFDKNFTNRDAAVACHQLGYSRYGAIPSSFVYYGRTVNVPFVIDSPHCDGYESSLFQCDNMSNLSYGEVDHYRGEQDHEWNTAGVRCEQYETENSNCSYLDVRLTFRSANSSGLVEICNDEGVWSIACRETLDEDEKAVLCRQLGFSTPTNSFREFIPSQLSETRPKFKENLICSSEEKSLVECQFHQAREGREVSTTCNYQAGVYCGAPPVIYFNPPNSDDIYTIKKQRNLNISCSWDQNIYPFPTLFTNITDSCDNFQDGQPVIAKTINFFHTNDAIPTDKGSLSCFACYGSNKFTTSSVYISVRVPQGFNESVFIRVSHISMERAMNTRSSPLTIPYSLTKQVQKQIISSINPTLPGLHIVDNCTTVNRRKFDTERRLDRLECQILTQYKLDNESVFPVIQVVQNAVAILQRKNSSVAVVGINVSATGFCNREIVIEEDEDVTFDWPETAGGENATFICPNNATVTRCCATGGVWQDFDYGACSTDVGFERLNQDNGHLLAIREGHSLQVCVVAFGNLASEESFIVFPRMLIDSRKKRGLLEDVIGTRSIATAVENLDYVIEYTSINRQRLREVVLTPDMERSCINITAIDDSREESSLELLTLRIYHDSISSVRVLPERSELNIVILDDDIECTSGERVCVDTELPSVTCIGSKYICDGVSDCKDASDEFDCPDYCQMDRTEGFNCLSEKYCVPHKHVCDGYPDCVHDMTVFDEINCIPSSDGCLHGDVRTPLLGGASASEGIVEVCVNGTYYPVSLDNGRFSVRETSAICNHLNFGNAGIPLNAAAFFAFYESRLAYIAHIRCDDVIEGGVANLSSCSISLVSTSVDKRQAGIRCLQTDPCEEGALRLSYDNLLKNTLNEGSDHDLDGEGRVEICFHNVWGTIYDQNWTNYDAAIACHHLGFSRYGAIPKPFVYYGNTDNVPFVLSGPLCEGNENSLFDCHNDTLLRFGEVDKYLGDTVKPKSMAGVRCEQYETTRCTYLDVRLTFRSAASSGLLEICDDYGNWSSACSSVVNENNAAVICRQLGFSSRNYYIGSAALIVTDQRPIKDELPSCQSREESLQDCLFSIITRTKRLASEICRFQAELRCGASPLIYFHPPSPNGFYTVEQERSLNLSCFWDPNVYPPVQHFIFNPERTHFGIGKRGLQISEDGRDILQSSVKNINFLQLINAQPQHDGEYTCTAYSADEDDDEVENYVSVEVLVPEFLEAFFYIRVSYPTAENVIHTEDLTQIDSNLFNTNFTVEQIQIQILSSISVELPGLHIIDNCKNVTRREIETERLLDRLECRISQSSLNEEILSPIDDIVNEAAIILERWSTFIVAINVSATGFCSRDVITTEYTTFDWPETVGGATANFLCPNNNNVTRLCGVGGIWGDFDLEGCFTDYCAESGIEGFNCVSEQLCVPESLICDGIPDCVQAMDVLDEMNCLFSLDDCTHGEIRIPLLGGADEMEGLIEVCVGGSFQPVILDNGRFSVREATAICRQLGLGSAGIPLNSLTLFGTELEVDAHAGKVRCDEQVESLSECSLSIINSFGEIRAGVRCIQTQSTENCENKEIRLVNDAPFDSELFQRENEGRLEVCFENVWGAIYDTNWTNKDAAVACHQLGFNRFRAVPTSFEYYGNAKDVPFVFSSPQCNGNENSLFNCHNDSNLAFGKINKYRGEPNDLRNTAGVRCEAIESQRCLYLETRLVLRMSNSTGFLEICNKQGSWSIACADSFDIRKASVVCRQLGFNSAFVNYFNQSFLLNVTPTFIDRLSCSGSETSLNNCSTIDEESQTDLDVVNIPGRLCDSNVYLQCGALPRIYFNPPSSRGAYSVEQQRHLILNCAWDESIFPRVTTITTSRASGGQSIVREVAERSSVPFVQVTNASTSDTDEYFCTTTSQLGYSEDSVNVSVRVPEGLNASVYLRISHVSLQRILNTITQPGGLVDGTNTFHQLNFQDYILSSINKDLPGLHIVDKCRNVSRPEFEIERGLDRLECRLTQYWNDNETVMPVLLVAQNAASLLLQAYAPLIVSTNVSVSGFCSFETVKFEDTVYIWQETIGGSNASFRCQNKEVVVTRLCEVGGQWQGFDKRSCANNSFCRRDVVQRPSSTYIWPQSPSGNNVSIMCPTNPDFVVTRECDQDGLWQSFDETACGVVIQLLSGLNNSFTNLSDVIFEDTVSVLAQIIEQSENNTIEQNSEVLNTIADYSTELATFVGDSDMNINDTVVGQMVEVVSSLLQWEPENIVVASSSSVLQSFEEIVSQYAQQLTTNERQSFSAQSLVVIAELRSTVSFAQEGRIFTTNGSEPLLVPVNQMMPDQLSQEQNAVVSLPRSLFQSLNFNSSENVGVFFGIYETANLFPVGGRTADSNAPRQARVCSQVLAATVGENITIQNLEEPVMVVLRLQIKEGMFTAPGSERCVSWDFDLQDWTTQGCNTTINGQDQTIICNCNHLTNFAVIVEVCPRQEDCQNSVARQLNELNNSFSNLTAETYESAVSMFTQVVEQSEERQEEQNSQVLGTVADYLTELATFVDNSNIIINNTIVDNLVQVVSSLLQWEPANVMAASSSRIIQSFEVVVSLFAQQLSLNERQNFTLPSLTLVAELRSVESLSIGGTSFAIGDTEAVLASGNEVMAGQLTPEQTAAISLPASLFQLIDNRTNVGVFFALYNSSVLFPVNGGNNINSDALRNTEVGSRVVAVTVGPGLEFQNLSEPVTIVLRLQITEGQFMAPGSEICVSWSFMLQDWTTQGCSTQVNEDGIVTCLCNHLTNFAVLVDVCLRQEDCLLSNNELFEDTLTFVSYIGMIISIISLVLTIITMLAFKKVREKDASKYHVQLSLAILFMLIVSLVLIGLSAENVIALYGGCVTVSILVHYFTLVAVMWMGAEALLMFQKLVIIFTRITTKFIISLSVVCWTIPIIFVLIPFIVDLANGNDSVNDIITLRANTTTTEEISFCFLSHPGAFWGAFLAPIIAVMIFNVVIFIWVIVILLRHTRGVAVQKKEALSKKTILRLMISIGGVMFLFGLTWLFAILTFSAPGLRETFQALFTVSNSFQGFFIFLFFCVFNKEAREHWKELLSCGRYTSDFLHPSHAKYNSSTGTGVRKNKKVTTSTGLSSTSATRAAYASETITKGSNVYESGTTANRLSAGNAEKIPLEYPEATQEEASITTTVIVETSLYMHTSTADDKEDLSQQGNTKHNDTNSEPSSVEEVSEPQENVAVVVADVESPIEEAPIVHQQESDMKAIKNLSLEDAYGVNNENETANMTNDHDISNSDVATQAGKDTMDTDSHDKGEEK